jgi:hypothetical protein
MSEQDPNPEPDESSPEGGANESLEKGWFRDSGDPVPHRRDFFRFSFAAALAAAGSASAITYRTAEQFAPEGPVEGVEKVLRPRKNEAIPVSCEGNVCEYRSVRHVMQKERFEDPEDPSGRMQALVDLHREGVYSAKKYQDIYYTLDGKIVGSGAVGTDIDTHNANRRAFTDSGAIVLPESKSYSGYPLRRPTDPMKAEVCRDALKEEVKDTKFLRIAKKKRYFEGEEVTLDHALRTITAEYGVPYAVIAGQIGQESTYDRKEVSDITLENGSTAHAYGLAQFVPETARTQAMPYMLPDPSFRKGRVSKRFFTEWKNRFVQIELLCAHYKYLAEKLEPKLIKLYARLRALDPNFNTSLEDFAVLTAYNAGLSDPDGRGVIPCIERFVELPDEIIKERIGEPPYGLDTWLAILAHSYGQPVDANEMKIGKSVFHYAIGSIALGAEITESDPLEELKAKTIPAEITAQVNKLATKLREEKEKRRRAVLMEEKRKRKDKRLRNTFLGSGFASVFLGIATMFRARREFPRDPGMSIFRRPFTRRSIVQVIGAFAAGVVFEKPIADAISASGIDCSPEPEIDYTKGHEIYPEVFEEMQDRINAEYAHVISEGEPLLLHKEIKHMSAARKERWNTEEVQAPAQRELLAEEFTEALGPNHNDTERYADWRGEEKLNEDLIQMKEDDQSKPYFCQQVGRKPGTKNDWENNWEALWMKPEFEPILGTLIAAMNYQIEIINQNPSAYGIDVPEGFRFPTIKQLKVSGALRSPEYAGTLVENGGVKKTAHFFSALDILSLMPNNPNRKGVENYRVATFAEPWEYEGQQPFELDNRLPSMHEYGELTRQLYSTIAGYALEAMREPLLEKEGITLLPLYESKPQNWHIVIKTPKKD